jgi:hypothetical protein
MRSTRRKTRKMKGGTIPSLKKNAIIWPEKEGCGTDFQLITFNIGEVFDRFGSTKGSYVSPMFETAERIAKEIRLSEEQPNVYSYTQRALPYIGINNSGFRNNNSRKLLYNSSYKKNTNKKATDYRQYKVLNANSVYGNACKIAPAFNTSGGGIQVKLTKNIETLLKEGAIEEIDISNIPPYFSSN